MRAVFLLLAATVVLSGCGRRAPLDVPPPPPERDGASAQIAMLS